jgi:hypothetical protein
MATEHDVHIRLQLEGEVDFVTFQVTARDLERVLRDIEEHITKRDSRIEWRWDDDAVITAIASPNGVAEPVITQIVKEARLGFERIARAAGGEIDWPPTFGRKARNALTRVVRKLNQVRAITVDTVHEAPLVIDHVEFKEKIGEPSVPKEFTSVDGVLELVSVRGRLNFTIEEHGTKKRIRCTVSDELFQKAKDALGKRVVVEGTMRFTRDGQPSLLSNVTSIWERPPEKRKLEDLQGIIPDFTNGESAEDYVRSIRGERSGGDN